MTRFALAVATILVAGTNLFAQNAAQTPSGAKTNPAPLRRTPYYVDPSVLNLSHLILPAPGQDSETTRKELADLHQIELTRTPTQIAAAQADDREEDIFVFANVIGPKFTMADLPLTAALSAHVHNDEAVMGGPLKAHYKRPRPFLFDATLHPVCRIDNDTAYPSGHSLSGYLLAFTMAEIVPEKTREILLRADDYAHNRLVCGVHYQSDVEASRRGAYIMFGFMMATPRFREDLAAARSETRTRLGLPPAQ